MVKDFYVGALVKDFNVGVEAFGTGWTDQSEVKGDEKFPRLN